MAQFAGRVLLSSVSDFVEPSQSCVVTEKKEEGEAKEQRQGQGTGTQQVAQISLADCLACSGCVTSAETVLLQHQSAEKVVARLMEGEGDVHVHISMHTAAAASLVHAGYASDEATPAAALADRVAAAVAAQAVSALAAKTQRAVHTTTGTVSDADAARAAVQEAMHTNAPVLISACPAVVCYVETQAPALLPHLSRVLSPMAAAGRKLRDGGFKGADARSIHIAVMPCFDKKLEAARPDLVHDPTGLPFVDFVLTTGEFAELIAGDDTPPSEKRTRRASDAPSPWAEATAEAGARQTTAVAAPRGAPLPFTHASGGFAHAAVEAAATAAGVAPVIPVKGRNADHAVATVRNAGGEVTARIEQVFGFRNIQNLQRRLASGTAQGQGAHVVEVMACPGGCANGAGQITGGGADSAEAKHMRACDVEAVAAASMACDGEQDGTETVDFAMPGSRWAEMATKSSAPPAKKVVNPVAIAADW